MCVCPWRTGPCRCDSVKVLRWADQPGLSGWTWWGPRALGRRLREELEETTDTGTEAEGGKAGCGQKQKRERPPGWLALEVEEGTFSAGIQWPPETGKCKETESTPELPEGLPLCWDLDISPERLISDFCQTYEIINLYWHKPVSLL